MLPYIKQPRQDVALHLFTYLANWASVRSAGLELDLTSLGDLSDLAIPT